MKKAGLYIFEIGLFGCIFGALAMDGPDLPAALALSLISVAVALTGHRIIQKAETREWQLQQAQEDFDRAQTEVFQWWLRCGTIGGKR